MTTHFGVSSEPESLADVPGVHMEELMVVESEPVVFESPPPAEFEVPEDEHPTDPWTYEELEAMALTLAGECYDDKPQDKRKVCETILNRVSSSEFPDTILGVVSYPNAFNGFWKQSRDVSEDDYEIAEQALRDWYANGCQKLSPWLFFCAGPNRENVFRSEY